MRIGFVCDLSPVIGAGHFMRSIALAEEFINQGNQVEMSVNLEGVPLAKSRSSEVLIGLRPEFNETHELLDWIRTSRLELIIWDSYVRPSEQSKAITEKAPLIALVDGIIRGQHADLYVDQNIDAHLDHIDSTYEVLAGTEFAILSDRIITSRRSQPRIIDSLPRQILIAMGGTDALGIAQSLSDSLSDLLPDVVINAIVPASKTTVGKTGAGSAINLNVLNPTTNLFEYISDSDLYVGGCGTSVWEALYIGTPMACLAVADNQVLTYGRLVDQKLVTGLGMLFDKNPDTAQIAQLVAKALENQPELVDMSSRGQAIIDGRGRERIVARAEELVKQFKIRQGYS